MKKVVILFMACMLVIPAYSQEPEVPEVPEVPDVSVPEPVIADTINVMNRVEVIESPDNTKVTLGENEVLIVEENGDTVRVILGSRGISIVEGENGTEIKIVEMDEKASNNHQSFGRKRKNKFRPHFAGIELGLNNFVTPDFSLVLPDNESYMDLNTGKSWNWNLNFLEYGLGFGTDKVGIVTGLGFEFINYNFDGQNSIRKDDITGDIIEYVPTYAGNITKSKMNITYLTAPLLLEFQIPAGRKRIHISGGVIGGIKLWSNTKMKYTVSGEKSKEKAKGDYNLSPLRWGFTARIGYRALNLFANYYMMPLFKEGTGPELYPFTIGLALIPF
ncbi:MAG: hypothetical protein DRI70_06210 [Bacteroidetes bacterium]|nr:MAG: hypothetical protein DRI70_06210 [Bacteroidota bacterium]